MPNKCNVYCEVNLTPVAASTHLWDKTTPQRHVQNGPSHDYLVNLGCRETFGLYQGTINRALCWATDDGTPRDLPRVEGEDRPDGVEWSRQRDNTNPLNLAAVKACALLTREENVGKYWPSSPSDPNMPMWFDIEHTKESDGVFYPNIDADIDARKQLALRMREAVVKAKTTNWKSPVWWYPAPPMPVVNVLWSEDRINRYREWPEIMKPFSDVIDAACVSAYNDYPDSKMWYTHVDFMTRTLDEFYPHMQRIADVQPVFPHTLTPIPLKTWKRQLSYLVDRGYDLFAWTGWTPPITGVKANLYVLKSFIY